MLNTKQCVVDIGMFTLYNKFELATNTLAQRRCIKILLNVRNRIIAMR